MDFLRRSFSSANPREFLEHFAQISVNSWIKLFGKINMLLLQEVKYG